jgi:general stress protein 26
MNRIDGLEEAFRDARVVFLSTFDGDKENTRQMTNFNDSPYGEIWFPTEKETRKVKDIQSNPRVLVTFPGQTERKFYEIEGMATLADQNFVDRKWRWWYLYWRPTQKRRFWFTPLSDDRRAIITVKPVKARLVERS